MSIRYLLLAAALSGASAQADTPPPVMVVAPPAPPAPPPAGPVDPVYTGIADLVAPDSQTDGQIDRLIEASLAAMEEQDPNLAMLEQRYPGLMAATGQAMRPLLIKASSMTVPLYRADLAAFYRANLSLAEGKTFLAFLRQPVSRAFFGGIAANASFKATANDLAAERSVSGKSVQRDTQAATLVQIGKMSKAETAQIAAFFATPLGNKLIALVSQKRAIDVKWANYSPPEIEAEMEPAVYNGMIGHIAKTDPEVAEAMRKELFPAAKGN